MFLPVELGRADQGARWDTSIDTSINALTTNEPFLKCTDQLMQTFYGLGLSRIFNNKFCARLFILVPTPDFFPYCFFKLLLFLSKIICSRRDPSILGSS